MNGESYVSPPTAAQRQARYPLRAIARLAERQHAIVTLLQLRRLGLSRHQVAHLVDVGWLHVVHRGVYAVGHPKLSDKGRRFAAVAAMGKDAVLTGPAASAHWQMLPTASGPIDVAVPKQRRAQPGIRPHEVNLDRRDWRTHDGVRVTTPERALLDLAAKHPHLLDRAIREGHYLKLVSPRSLVEICNRHKARRGVKVLRAAIADADLDNGATREEFERRFRIFLKEHDLPLPLFNQRLDVAGRMVTPDCLWQDQRLIIELDGHAAHGTPHAFEQDRARDRALQAAGYHVIRITWRQLHEGPEALLIDLRHFLVDVVQARR